MDKKAVSETNGLAVASLIFGVLTILTCWTMVLPVPQALLAFMFALLSRGNRRSCGVAKAGALLAVIGLVLTMFVVAAFGRWLVQLYTSVPMAEDVTKNVLNEVQGFLNSIEIFLNGLLNGAGGAL